VAVQSNVVARSRDLESEATRRSILDAAEELIASGGEEGLSIRELCARVGVTAPTIYHHFGDKAALVARVVDECFADFDRALAERAAPADPVEALRWGFDRYVEYGVQHPRHYRLLFETKHRHASPSGLRAYDTLRRSVGAIDAAGRLLRPVEEATAAMWSAMHGVASLVVNGFYAVDAPVVGLVRDTMIDQLTRPPRPRTPDKRQARRKERARHAARRP
jgi:AcrR family transcriptional regulator